MLLDPCKSSVLHHDGHALVTAVSHPYAVRGAGDSARDTLSRVFPGPQIVLFSRDVERLAAFYTEFGFPETFRVRAHGQPIHIDVSLDSYVIGIASLESTRDDHGLDPVGNGQRGSRRAVDGRHRFCYQKLASRGCLV